MKVKQFITERSNRKNTKYRTMNIDADLHQFYKKTANHYNLPLSELVYNILDDWRLKYQEEIKADILKELDKY